MIHYVTFKDEVLPGVKVNSLENIEIKKGMKGFIYQNRLVLFGKKISLHNLKQQHYYNAYFLDFIKKLEANNINYVCEYCNGFYESIEGNAITYEEFKKEIADNKEYQIITKSEYCSETNQDLIEIENLTNLNDDKANKVLIPFVLSLVAKLNQGLSPIDLIEYLVSLNISEDLMTEIVSLVALYCNNGEVLLDVWNNTYYTDLNFRKGCIELTRK